MRTVPKRKLARMLKRSSTALMDVYFNNEYAIVVYGVSVISDEKAWEICDTLSHYAHILYRNFDEKSFVYEDEWAKLLLDFY